VLHGYHIAFSDVAQLTCGVVRGSGAVGCGFHVIVCQLLPLLCVVVVLLGGHGCLLGSCHRLWWQSFVGPWQSFVVQWQSFVVRLLSFGGQGCLQWWGLCDVAWGQCVEVVVVGS